MLALGGTKLRKFLYHKFIEFGLKPYSVISSTSIIGDNSVFLEKGLNIMHFVFIANDVQIGTGCLINTYASIHHDVRIGDFVEISPRATLLGATNIGNETSIGAGAIILPNIRKIGNNCIIGAGALVTKDLPDNVMAYGVPAKIVKTINEN